MRISPNLFLLAAIIITLAGASTDRQNPASSCTRQEGKSLFSISPSTAPTAAPNSATCCAICGSEPGCVVAVFYNYTCYRYAYFNASHVFNLTGATLMVRDTLGPIRGPTWWECTTSPHMKLARNTWSLATFSIVAMFDRSTVFLVNMTNGATYSTSTISPTGGLVQVTLLGFVEGYVALTQSTPTAGLMTVYDQLEATTTCWSAATDAEYPEAILDGGVVIAANTGRATLNGSLIAYNFTNGAIMWSIQDGSLHHQLAITAGLVFSVTSTLDSTSVNAYDAATGFHMWSVNALPGTVVRAAGDEYILVADTSKFQLLSVSTGTAVWRVPLQSSGNLDSLVADANVFAWVADLTLITHSIVDGSIKWKSPAGSMQARSMPHITTFGSTIAVHALREIIAYNASTGVELWRSIETNPTMNNDLRIVSGDGHIVAAVDSCIMAFKQY